MRPVSTGVPEYYDYEETLMIRRLLCQIAPGVLLATSLAGATPQEDGSVHQQFDGSKDGGENWNVLFDGIYTRRGD